MKLTRDNTALVVDSTADLTPTLREDPNVFMVPLDVHFGDESLRDWVDITPDTFYPRLVAAEQLPTTSQPSAGAFLEMYREVGQTFEHVFSLHLSGGLSGTVTSAQLAQEEAPNVTVIDTKLASVGVALLVDRLLVQLEAGVEEDDLLTYVERYPERVGFLFVPATLEYLQKGGRIGRANRIAGGLLSIRPLLTMAGGEVDAYKKVRGEKKAMAAIRQYLLDRTDPEKTVYAAVAHAQAPEKGRELAKLVEGSGLDIDLRIVGRLGSVIGTYVGPDTIGLFFIQE